MQSMCGPTHSCQRALWGLSNSTICPGNVPEQLLFYLPGKERMKEMTKLKEKFVKKQFCESQNLT